VNQLQAALEMACILSLPTLAAILTFRFAGFPDLSVDGVVGLGAAMFARSFLAHIPLWGCLGLSFLAGMAAGALTASMSNRLRISPILASVVMLTVLYTVNLRVLGKANQPLFGVPLPFGGTGVGVLGFLATAAVLAFAGLSCFFRTELGSALRATGTSAAFLEAIGRDVATQRVGLVSLAGGLVALSGAMLGIHSGFADVTIGNGIIVIGIAALTIGEKILGRDSLSRQLGAAPAGVLVYSLVVGVALAVGVRPTDVKLATGVLVVILLASRWRTLESFVA
jgi:putative ABC transport system permease protein